MCEGASFFDNPRFFAGEPAVCRIVSAAPKIPEERILDVAVMINHKRSDLLFGCSEMRMNAMTNDELRIAIAVASGWTSVRRETGGALVAETNGLIALPVEIPDWPNDPRAAADLEKWLRIEGKWREYIAHLSALMGCAAPLAERTATSRQRAEAALAALETIAA